MGRARATTAARRRDPATRTHSTARTCALSMRLIGEVRARSNVPSLVPDAGLLLSAVPPGPHGDEFFVGKILELFALKRAFGPWHARVWHVLSCLHPAHECDAFTFGYKLFLFRLNMR